MNITGTIHMVDLVGQYLNIKDQVDQKIQHLLDTGRFIGGSEVEELREGLAKLLNVRHVTTCANGTDALQLAIMALDLNPGDEVIVPSFTFIASVEVVAFMGLVPVCADVDIDDFNIDSRSMDHLLSDRSKVIMPVHLFGQGCHMQKIMRFAKEHDLKVIEDNAQSIGSKYLLSDGSYQPFGGIGDIGTTSFYPAKNLGCYGDGGAVFAQDDELGDRLWKLANHGQYSRYYHDEVGVNSRLDSIQAAVLNIKLSVLDTYQKKRQEVAASYDDRLSQIDGIKVPYRRGFSEHVFHQYTIRVRDGRRDALKDFLAKHEIPSMIYYPVPIHQQKAYKDIVVVRGDLDVTEQLAEEVLSLPIHTEMQMDQIEYITSTIHRFFSE